MHIRDAAQADLSAINEIYNQVLLTSTAIYTDTPVTPEERLTWWQTRCAQGYPVLVAEDEGVILGFATFGDFRPWPGYRYTVEGTIHIREGCRSRGLGRLLLDGLIERARALGKHTLIAGADSENAASLRFLEKHGFARVGYLPEVGFKFGRFLDLVLLQYRLAAPVAAAVSAKVEKRVKE
jgi:L-amino acid N-acyltransferase YncA